MTIEFRAPDQSGPGDLAVIAEHDGTPVGRLGALATDLTVPGGFRLVTAAIAELDVDPAHRRDGVLTGMMEHLLTKAHASGHVFACMTSPEATIHGRFGFGVAADRCSVEVDVDSARPIHRPADGAVEILDAVDAAIVAETYNRCARTRVGTIARTKEMWRPQLDEASIAVIRDSTGLADGFVRYDVASAPVGTVHELWGASNEVERALWAYLLSIDGIDTWRGSRPADDPLRFAVADVRSFRPGARTDELWLRVLDVDVALGTREYSASSRAITLRVVDPLINSNSGTFRIDAYGSFRSQGDIDLEVGIEALSALYLGGTSFHDLHGAGRVHERRIGAVGDADDLFVGGRLPYCGSSV